MVLQQRVAVFNLMVGVVAVAIFCAMMPWMGLERAQGGFAVLALTGLVPVIFRRRGAVVDERDQSVQLRAFQVTFVMLWLLFVAGVWGIYWMNRLRGYVPLDVVTLVGWLGWAAFLICHSAALLVLYGRS